MDIHKRTLLSGLLIAPALCLMSCSNTPPVSGQYKNDTMQITFDTTSDLSFGCNLDLKLKQTITICNEDRHDAKYEQRGDTLIITSKKWGQRPLLVYTFKIIKDGAQLRWASTEAPDLHESQQYPDDNEPIFTLSKVLQNSDD